MGETKKKPTLKRPTRQRSKATDNAPQVTVMSDVPAEELLSNKEAPVINLMGVELEMKADMASLAAYQRVLENHFDGDTEAMGQLDTSLLEVYASIETSRRRIRNRLDLDEEVRKKLIRLSYLDFMDIFTIDKLKELMDQSKPDEGNAESE